MAEKIGFGTAVMEGAGSLLKNATAKVILGIATALLCGFSFGIAIKMFLRGNPIIGFSFLSVALAKASAFWYLVVKFR